jgi:GH3 auxin-responsive promoter
VPYGNFFAHHWYVACDNHVNAEELKTILDQKLKELNDDYAVERKSALKEVIVDVFPAKTFMDFMHSKGKVGGQHKFPRVLKGGLLQEWQKFTATKQPSA